MKRAGGVSAPSEAEALIDRGYFAQAELRLRADLLETPDDPWKQALLGRALIQQGESEEGEYLLNRARELAPEDPRILSLWTIIPAMMDSLEEALRLLDRAEAMLPNDPDIMSRRGMILIGRGQREEAERLFREAIARDAGMVRANAGLGQLLLAQGQYEEAVEVLLRVDDCRNCVNRWLAEAFTMLERYEEALDHAEREIRNNPEDESAWYYKVCALMGLGREEDALAALETLDRVSAQPGLALSMRALIHLEQERWDQALPTIEEMVEFDPSDPSWQLHLARCLEGLGKQWEARRAFEEAIRLDSEGIDGYAAFAEFCERHHENETLIELRTRMAELEPENELRWFELALASYRQGAIGAALRAWRRVRERGETLLPSLCTSHAQLMAGYGRVDEAVEIARMLNELGALDADPFRLYVKTRPSGSARGIGVENASPITLSLIKATLPFEDLSPSPDCTPDYGFRTEGQWQDPGRGAVSPAYTREELLALERAPERKWTEVIRRSRRRPGCFYVRDSIHPECDSPEDWRRLRQICTRLGIWYDDWTSCGPIGPESWTLDAPFLDGGVIARGGTYSPTNGPPPGAWIVGENAMRLACYVLGLTQPRRFRLERCVPSFAHLCETILLQRTLPEEILRARFQRMEDSYGMVFTFQDGSPAALGRGW